MELHVSYRRTYAPTPTPSLWSELACVCFSPGACMGLGQAYQSDRVSQLQPKDPAEPVDPVDQGEPK
uniref:Uncharacterized protein n=1 Tax=Knipowitschia caucasica TaxID=637954 RepID=A0AAV2KUI4_KNICA